jgi:hypothetical protein
MGCARGVVRQREQSTGDKHYKPRESSQLRTLPAPTFPIWNFSVQFWLGKNASFRADFGLDLGTGSLVKSPIPVLCWPIFSEAGGYARKSPSFLFSKCWLFLRLIRNSSGEARAIQTGSASATIRFKSNSPLAPQAVAPGLAAMWLTTDAHQRSGEGSFWPNPVIAHSLAKHRGQTQIAEDYPLARHPRHFLPLLHIARIDRCLSRRHGTVDSIVRFCGHLLTDSETRHYRTIDALRVGAISAMLANHRYPKTLQQLN